jgi:large subunit ribosomal protein L29e
MSKSKNHTNHNQNRKAHRNGIRKPPRHRFPSRRGVDRKFLRNQRYAIRGTRAALARKAREAKAETKA